MFSIQDCCIFFEVLGNFLSQSHGLVVYRASYRSFVMGSIHGWSVSHFAYIPDSSERKLTSL